MIDLSSRVLFQDSLMIVINKPPGIPVHAGPSGGESLEDYFDQLQFGYKEMPRLAHRLDRDTSGCLVLGRNDRAIKKLGKLFEAGRIAKTYWAIVDKPLPAAEGNISTPLKKIKLAKGWSMQPAKSGDAEAQEASTDYKTIKNLGNGLTLVELYPRTGRTHQIRVHLQSIGCPIVNDWLYGANKERPESFLPLHLHARQISVPLYEGQDAITVTADPPPHMAKLIS